jgi:hypothetical protein
MNTLPPIGTRKPLPTVELRTTAVRVNMLAAASMIARAGQEIVSRRRDSNSYSRASLN